MRFTNILLVLESITGGAQALRRTLALAHKEQANLTICKVVDSIPSNRLRTITAVTPWEMMGLEIAEQFDQLEQFIRSFNTRHVPIHIKILVGKPHVEIITQIKTNHYDLLIKPARWPGGDVNDTVKKEDRDLVRNCPCPVWLVSASDQNEYSPILAALDIPSEGKSSKELNEHILKVARSLALAEFRCLHIVHALHTPEAGRLSRRSSPATSLEHDRKSLRELERRKDWLATTVHDAKSDSEQFATEHLDPDLHVLNGRPVDVLPKLAGEIDAGLIVMGTAARRGMAGIWLGNTSEKVLSYLNCSLLIVRGPEPSLTATETDRTELDFHRSRKTLSKSAPLAIQNE